MPTVSASFRQYSAPNVRFGKTYEVSSIKVRPRHGASDAELAERGADQKVAGEAAGILWGISSNGAWLGPAPKNSSEQQRQHWRNAAIAKHSATQVLKDEVFSQDEDFQERRSVETVFRNGKLYLIAGWHPLYHEKDAVGNILSQSLLHGISSQGGQAALERYQQQYAEWLDELYFSPEQISPKKIELELTPPPDPVKDQPYHLTKLNIVG
jgi:hypothetical protein